MFRINDELVHKEHGFGSALFFPDDFKLSVKSKLERLGEANG